MGKAKEPREKAVFQPIPWATADLARQHGWAHLRDILKRAGISKRAFESWRECQLVPRGIRPAAWRKSGARGGFDVLWPPELEEFLGDLRHMTGSLQMRGQNHRVTVRAPATSHAALRLGLWLRAWEYDMKLIQATFNVVLDRFGQLLPKRFTLSDVARWLYASAKVYEPTGARDDPSKKRPRRAWDVESVRRLILFVHGIRPWIGVTLTDKHDRISAFWMGKASLTTADLKSLLSNADGLERLREGWRKILNALMFQSSPDPFLVEAPSIDSPLGTRSDDVAIDLIWQTIKNLDKDAHHVTNADEVERWAARWEQIKHTIPEEERANITLVQGSAWNLVTGRRVAELERTYRPGNFTDALDKLLKYLGVIMLLIAGHQGRDVVTEGAAARPYEPTKGMFCPRCQTLLEPEPGWPPLWERLRKPRPLEHQRCPSCLAVWVIPGDPEARKPFQAMGTEVAAKQT